MRTELNTRVLYSKCEQFAGTGKIVSYSYARNYLEIFGRTALYIFVLTSAMYCFRGEKN